jgi:starch synthase
MLQQSTSDEELARMIYAGSDDFVAASTYEPRGLGRLTGLRYGSIPIVRRTGGMGETTSDCPRNPAGGLDLKFTPRSPEHLLLAVGKALAVYRREPERLKPTRRATDSDLGSTRSVAADVPVHADALQARALEESVAGAHWTARAVAA